ncbi:hypothetical protein C5167_040451 [Papaver somniferum]|uniref:IST1-like protein n=1 Tax=Papaver somniferum TaxID=3469 RepID=A0A4Y7IHF8_PAPSO|nr:uncharacterized protein LOC113316281 [Papaver somniferum]RZC47506.1 hypothetical protein C5167_040451 [Papaver somniferum]
MNLLYIFFGWRKASTCKRLIKRVQCRIKLLKNKRDSVIRHYREDIIQLLKNGQDHSAFSRVGQLSNDQNIVAAYELLDHFCEFIMMNLPYIRQNRDCPNDINEAASSLLYASARCGDLPELPKLRKLFGERYGNRFAVAAVELLPGNLVNRQLIQKLSAKSISDDAKFRLMKEIARENCVETDPSLTDIQYQQQQNDVEEFYSAIGDFHWDVKDPDLKTESSPCIELLQDVKQLDTREDTKFDAFLSDSRELVIASKVDNIPAKLDTMDEPEVVFQDSQRNSRTCSITSEVSNSTGPHKIEAITGVTTTSEDSFQMSERSIVYLDDDVEEFEPTTPVDGNVTDQRVFIFKSVCVPLGKESTEQDKITGDSKRSTLSDDRIEKLVSSDGKTSSRCSSSRRRKSSRRRLKRRYLSMENQSPTSVCSSIMDTEYAFYYTDSRHNRRKNQKSNQEEAQ